MKKLIKALAGLTVLAGIAAGVYYFLKGMMNDEEFEDEEEIEETTPSSREYVTLDLEDEEEEEAKDSKDSKASVEEDAVEA